MSKVDIAVGDAFPLDESRAEGRHGHRRHGHHGRHHHHHGGHHHLHHRRHGFGRLALLLTVAGLAALIVEHRLPAAAAWSMVALGLTAIAVAFALRWRRHRRFHRQVP